MSNRQHGSTIEAIAATLGPTSGLPICSQFFQPNSNRRSTFPTFRQVLKDFAGKNGGFGLSKNVLIVEAILMRALDQLCGLIPTSLEDCCAIPFLIATS